LVLSYYRDRALSCSWELTPLEMLLESVGAEADPNSHGRQMPSHWGHKKLNIVSQVVTYRYAAFAGGGLCGSWLPGKADQGTKEADQGISNDEVVYVSLGDGRPAKASFGKRLILPAI